MYYGIRVSPLRGRIPIGTHRPGWLWVKHQQRKDKLPESVAKLKVDENASPFPVELCGDHFYQMK